MLKIEITNLKPEGELMLIAFLKRLEHLGNIGSSKELILYSDGDGNFRPKVKIETDIESIKNMSMKQILKYTEIKENFFDNNFTLNEE